MSHSSEAEKFIANGERVAWHDKALWHVREKRDGAVQELPEWEALRNLGAAIKAHTLSRLDQYLLHFEEQAQKNGIQVHWAADAEEHNAIVYQLLKEKGINRVVKSKSMLTEECHLNPYLEKKGVEVVDSDLGERIVQLAKEPPSHIVLPSIHKKREEIDTLFQEHLHTQPSGGDEVYLTRAARAHLRDKFLLADAAITGVNFAVAETGEFVICTNEGNADMGVHLAGMHIACMGIEKVIPRLEDVGVFTRLLARSATGQPITTYTAHFKKPRPGQEMHVILVDNGRTEQLSRPDFRSSLHCIRCGACMNTCPIYRRSGGHSYGSVVPGPIGSILSPGFDLKKHASLPFASSLCGSCSDVCPVKIDIHTQLYKWRQLITEDQGINAKSLSMKTAAWVFNHPNVYKHSGKIARGVLKRMPDWMRNHPANLWARQREVPEPPQESFGEWYVKNRGKKGE